MNYCGANRSVTAFIFRSWHALLARWDRDLGELKRGLERRVLLEPNEALPLESDNSPATSNEDTPRLTLASEKEIVADETARRE